MIGVSSASVGALRPVKFYTADGVRTVAVKRKLPLMPFVLAAVICALAIPLAVMNAVRVDTEIAEWWTRHIEQGWEVFAGTLTSWLPVSVFELCIVFLIGLGVFLYVRLIVNLGAARFKRILTGLLWLGTAAIFIFDMYTMSMGFGYYRAPMPLYTAGADYTAHQTVTAAQYFLDDYNALANGLERDENGCVKCPYTFRELAKQLKLEYARLDDDYFFSYTPTAKEIVNSWILSDFMITGITFLPTGEANLNVEVPPTSVTSTLAHELAHTKGIQREGDANMLSYYILLSSQDDYLRYCGYYATFYSFLYAVAITGESQAFSQMKQSLSPLITAEQRYTQKFWDEQPDIMGQIGEFFNNIYLMFNGATNGTGSYNDGTQSGIVIPTDPDTDEPIIDPDTQKPVIIPVYSTLQKMYFYIYEQQFGAPSKQ